MEKLLSVIIPVYKVEKYISKCIESVIDQTYKNLEIIIVDDGSPDNSGEICEKYARKDSRIQVIHQENQGLSGARNRGLDRATGDYITFVDSDDWIHPNMYEIMMKQFGDSQIEIVVCDYQEVLEGQEPAKVDICKCSKTIMTEKELDNGYLMFEKKTRFVVAWNKIYKRSFFDDIRYPVGKIHEDAFTTYKLLNKAKGVLYIDIPLYYYVIRETSIMGEGFSDKRLLILDALIEEMVFFEIKQKYKVLGLVFLDYRDYLIDYKKKIKSENEYSLDILKPYFSVLNKYLVKMKKMQIPLKKQIKSFIFAKFHIVIM